MQHFLELLQSGYHVRLLMNPNGLFYWNYLCVTFPEKRNQLRKYFEAFSEIRNVSDKRFRIFTLGLLDSFIALPCKV